MKLHKHDQEALLAAYRKNMATSYYTVEDTPQGLIISGGPLIRTIKFFQHDGLIAFREGNGPIVIGTPRLFQGKGWAVRALHAAFRPMHTPLRNGYRYVH